MPIWGQYECPFCGGPAWRGDPRTGMNYRGSARCDACGKGFSAIRMKAVAQVEWPEPVPTPEMLIARERMARLDAYLAKGIPDPVCFDDRFEALHPRGQRGMFLSHAALTGEVSKKIEDALARDNIPEDKARAYRDALRGVFASASTGAMKLIRDRVEDWRFRSSIQELDAVYRGLTTKPSGTVGAFVLYREGGKIDVFLDGGHDTGERHASLKPEDVTAHVYRHEIGHVLDGKMADKSDWVSMTPEWKVAWKKEIDGTYTTVPITFQAMKSPTEGWAEFHRLILTDRRLARRKFPDCWEICRRRHLV